MKVNWSALIRSLCLIRFGQMLGTDCETTQSIACIIDSISSFFRR